MAHLLVNAQADAQSGHFIRNGWLPPVSRRSAPAANTNFITKRGEMMKLLFQVMDEHPLVCLTMLAILVVIVGAINCL